ncbi:MAG: methionyl-tRNA formyltransferase [Armatimonadota bacterium]|jgi:methionyl-tRNA formyltransferase
MKTVFFGTPATAAEHLEAVDSVSEVAAVVTQPDRPRGRGRKVCAPPAKVAAQGLGIEVLQPERASDEALLERVREIAPDVVVVVAYGQKLPMELLEVPPRGAINVHFSLLPELRGAAPVFWAIARGYDVTGVTTMYMVEEMDAGDMILSRGETIRPDDTSESLEERLSGIGCGLLQETLRLVTEGRAPRTPQDHTRATRAPLVKRESVCVEWSQPAAQIERLVRAAIPWPVAFTVLNGQPLRVYRARVAPDSPAQEGTAGRLIEVTSETGLSVLTGMGVIHILEVQSPGRRRMPAADFARGARLAPGMLLG